MLLDTHVVLWLLQDDRQLGPGARRAIGDAARVCVSSASVWEIAIKRGLGKLEVPDDLLARVERAGLQWLSIDSQHTWAAQHVTLPHNDPFDHLLVSQAIDEGLTLVTADQVLLSTTTTATTMDARI